MFIIYTAFFAIAYAAIITLLYAAMQDGEMFDILTNGSWGKWLKKLYHNGNKLESVLGGCAKCTSFWFALPFTILYTYSMYQMHLWQFGVIMSFIWFNLCWGIFSFVGLYTLIKSNK